MNEELICHKIDVHDRRINNHSERIDKLEVAQGETNVKIDNLCKNLALQTKALWALISLGAATLVGFFIYAIESKIF